MVLLCCMFWTLKVRIPRVTDETVIAILHCQLGILQALAMSAQNVSRFTYAGLVVRQSSEL